MLKKTFAFILGTAVAGTLLAGAAAAQEKLRVATEGAYPPFNYTEASGKLAGFDVEIAEALCVRLKAECEIVAQDWDGIIPGLLAKKYDMIVASMFITEQRKQQVSFTDIYYRAAMTLVAPKNANLTDFSDKGLAGKVIGAQSGTTQGEYAVAAFPSADVRLYPNQDDVNMDLASGRLDLQVSDLLPMLGWTRDSGDGACCELVGEPITDEKFVGEGVGIALRKGDDALRTRLNEALVEIRNDGTYAKINAKYFPIDIYTLK